MVKDVHRRLAAILAADVVGYSRLMGEDEAGTLTALKAHRKELIEPKLAQNHGRTIKLMGDGTLMEFGSVVDAVAFAVDVQTTMRERNSTVREDRQIVYRLGINIGDVIVEGDDIYGDGVNVAARLEGLAEPGGICVRRNVRNQVRNKLDIDFEELGEFEVTLQGVEAARLDRRQGTGERIIGFDAGGKPTAERLRPRAPKPAGRCWIGQGRRKARRLTMMRSVPAFLRSPRDSVTPNQPGPLFSRAHTCCFRRPNDVRSAARHSVA